jgi:hypothetical protein
MIIFIKSENQERVLIDFVGLKFGVPKKKIQSGGALPQNTK